MKRVRIVVFAKAPMPGLAKTRLTPALGERGAARLARRMLDHTLSQALAVPGVDVELCTSPPPGDATWSMVTLPPALNLAAQGGGDLGARLERAAVRAFAEGVCPLFIGTDCPELHTEQLAAAVRALDAHDVFLHGTTDGGYAVLALGCPVDGIFTGIDWSTAMVFEQTVERIRAAGLSWGTGQLLSDIDEQQDLRLLPQGWLENESNEIAS